MKFYNPYHLGDHVFSLIYLNKLVEKYDISFSVKPEYINEIKILNYKNIKIDASYVGNINAWINADNYWSNYIKQNKVRYHDEFYLNFYNNLSKKYNFDIKFNNIEDTLFYHPDLEFSRYEHYDILIMNSFPMSGQYNYNKKDFYDVVNKLAKKYKIITTEKINNYECTRDKNMTLLDLANLSLKCDIIIGVHSAPYSVVLNKRNINTVKKWIVLNRYNITYKVNNNFDYYDDIKKINL